MTERRHRAGCVAPFCAMGRNDLRLRRVLSSRLEQVTTPQQNLVQGGGVRGRSPNLHSKALSCAEQSLQPTHLDLVSICQPVLEPTVCRPIEAFCALLCSFSSLHASSAIFEALRSPHICHSGVSNGTVSKVFPLSLAPRCKPNPRRQCTRATQPCRGSRPSGKSESLWARSR